MHPRRDGSHYHRINIIITIFFNLNIRNFITHTMLTSDVGDPIGCVIYVRLY